MAEMRKATPEDLQVLVQVRLDFARHMAGSLAAEDEALIKSQMTSYLTQHFDRDFIAILARVHGRLASCAFLTVAEQPAHRFLPTGKIGTLLNVYTYPEYRRQGLGIRVVSRVIDEARAMGVSAIDLLATPDGKPLYEQLGFREPIFTAMRLRLD
jgi:GNAT superfamily N-acetyltransferase